MNNLIKIIPAISALALTGCPEASSGYSTELSSDDAVINLEKGYKLVDVKFEVYRRTGRTYAIYTLTRKRKESEKPEVYKLDKVFNNGGGMLPEHITIIEN